MLDYENWHTVCVSIHLKGAQLCSGLGFVQASQFHPH